MSMRTDQKGFTIVELLIAVAILSIVILSVCGFILVGSRGYAAGNSDINVQQEAELALNQMSDVLIDTTRSVIYAAYDASGDPVTALKDAEFSFTPEDKSLIMFNGVVVEDPGGGPDTIEDGNGNKHYHFYWSKAKETLFYAEQDLDDPARVDAADIIDHFPEPAAADPDADPETTGWYVLASHVTDFSVDLSQIEEKRVVQLSLTFVDGTKEYVTSNNVTIRNKVGVNDAELAPLNKKVEIDITVKSSLILEPGETFVLPAPKVTGKNVTDKSVTWSLVAPDPADPAQTPNGSTLTTDGILKLSKDEIGSFVVRATTSAEDSDHNRPSADITVNVKRVTGIDLWKSYDSDPGNGPNEVSPGCTFTVSGRVVGDFLDQTCDACGDDTSIDRHILSTKSPILGTDEHVWRVWDPYLHEASDYIQKNPNLEGWHPSQHVKNVEQDEYSATFHVTPDTSDAGDHGYVIQVMSLLSYYRPYGSPTYKGRFYDWVWPSISFKVVKSKGDIQVDGGFKWGAMSNIKIDPYPSGFNRNGQGYYLICARIREEGAASDRVMIYGTTGNNSLVTPDLFGLEDISKSWEVSLQVIDPGQHHAGGVNPGPGVTIPSDPDQITDQTVRDAVRDYLANCDASGTYTGSYPHTGKVVGILKPPVIYYKYDGRENISGKLKLNTVNTLTGPEYTGFEVSRVENTRGDRDGVSAFTNDHLKFNVYKEKGEGKTEPIYWYDKAGKDYKGSSGPYNGTLQFTNFGRSTTNPSIKLEKNNKSYFADAAGTYRFVPSVVYTQEANVDTSYKVYYASYQPSYGVEQCYEVPESTVSYELVNGGNLKLWSYADNQFTKGEIYFPTPSEAGFTSYFNPENREWQNAKKNEWFIKSIDGSNNTTYYVSSAMRCRYVPDSKVYELELFYDYFDSTWNRLGKVSAGVFQCAANGDKWVQKSVGDFDSRLERGERNLRLGHTATMSFTVSVGTFHWNIYIPLPSERAFSGTDYNGFGFKLKQGAEQSIGKKKLKYQTVGQTDVGEFEFTKVSCTYDAAKDEYRLILTGTENDSYTFTCKSDGKQWTRQQ